MRPVIFLRTTSSIGLIFAIIVSFQPGWLSAQIMRSPAASASATTPPSIHWPKPGQLLKEIQTFEEHPVTKVWAARTKELAQFLCTETEVESQKAIDVLMALNQQARSINGLIGQIAQTSQQFDSQGYDTESAELISELQRFEYRLNRRIKIWAGVIDHTKSFSNAASPTARQVSLARLPRNLDVLLEQQIPNNSGWQEYLAWDELVRASRVTNMDKKATVALRKAAQKFLARYHSPALTDAHRHQFQPFFSPDVLDSIHDAASSDANLSRTMALIELLERENSNKYTSYLNSEYQNLLWSNDPIENELAATIDSHWRNANFRIAINERLLNQMLPQVPATTEPIRENIQGAEVSGQSLIETDQLRIALLPNPNEISLAVETVGQVTSETTAQRSGFTFENRGLADFRVFQKLAFSRTGITSEAPQATSSARQRLIGLRGNYDRIPVLGKLTRKIAKQKVNEQTPEANQLTRQRVESGAKQRVEQEVNQLVNQFRRGVQDHILERLIAMDLEPEIMQLSTTQSRILGRYRLAGRDQMAAYQPRPTDFESDLLTVQIHQSALNNLIQRFALNGQEFNAVTLGQHVEKVTGIPYARGSIEAEATFRFDKHDAIRVDFEDGIASVTFGFDKFQIGKGRPWRKIFVTAHFKPTYIGTRIVLDRDNVFDVKSKKDLRLADQIAIRTAFKVILEEQYAFDLVPAVVRWRVPGLNLAIDRLSLAEGWCGVALENAAVMDQPIPIVSPEEVVPGTWSDQLGSFQVQETIVQPPVRTARELRR